MVEPLKGIKLDQPWRGWMERLQTRVDASASKVVDSVAGHVFVSNSDGDLVDSGSVLPSGDAVDEEWVKDYVDSQISTLETDSQEWASERFITENLLDEAGTEEPIILVSPDKSRWELTVNNAGILGVTKLS